MTKCEKENRKNADIDRGTRWNCCLLLLLWLPARDRYVANSEHSMCQLLLRNGKCQIWKTIYLCIYCQHQRKTPEEFSKLQSDFFNYARNCITSGNVYLLCRCTFVQLVFIIKGWFRVNAPSRTITTALSSIRALYPWSHLAMHPLVNKSACLNDNGMFLHSRAVKYFIHITTFNPRIRRCRT